MVIKILWSNPAELRAGYAVEKIECSNCNKQGFMPLYSKFCCFCGMEFEDFVDATAKTKQQDGRVTR